MLDYFRRHLFLYYNWCTIWRCTSIVWRWFYCVDLRCTTVFTSERFPWSALSDLRLESAIGKFTFLFLCVLNDLIPLPFHHFLSAHFIKLVDPCYIDSFLLSLRLWFWSDLFGELVHGTHLQGFVDDLCSCSYNLSKLTLLVFWCFLDAFPTFSSNCQLIWFLINLWTESSFILLTLSLLDAGHLDLLVPTHLVFVKLDEFQMDPIGISLCQTQTFALKDS